jgi:hypothetical protein
MEEIQAELMPLYAVSEADAKLFIKWMQTQRTNTDFDPSVLGYPRACMARVHQGEEPIAMVPIHPVFMLESLARNPELTDSQLVLALNSIDKKVQQAMQDSGIAETFFQTNNERFAYICERHGWIKALYDPVKKEWLMKKRANIDWTKLLEAENACND